MKNFWASLTGSVSDAVDYIVEKNRKAALINRVKTVIRSEEKNIDRAYRELGKYYFQNLRDASNIETEHLCESIDHSNQRIDRAVTKLEELTGEDACDTCSSCGGDCSTCWIDGADCEEPTPEPEAVSQKDLDDLNSLDGAQDASVWENTDSEDNKTGSNFPYDV